MKQAPDKTKALTLDDWQMARILVGQGIDAMTFKNIFYECWFNESQAKALLAKLEEIDDEIRGGVDE